MTQHSAPIRGDLPLTQHYQAQARQLAAALPQGDDLRQRLETLDGDLHQGFSDALADRFERLAGELSQRQNPLAYLLDTDTGRALHQRAHQRALQQERLVQHLGQQLDAPDLDPQGRLRQASALRAALREHLELWSHLAHHGALAPDLTAPGELLQRHLQAIEAPAPTPRAADPAATAGAPDPMAQTAARALARGRAARQPQGDLDAPLATGPAPDRAAEAQELLRARLDRAALYVGDGDARARLEDLDAQMAQAARAYGAAYVQVTAERAAPALDEAAPVDLSALLQLRADLARRRADLRGQPLDAPLATGALADPARPQELIQAAQRDLDQLDDLPDEGLQRTRAALASALEQALALRPAPASSASAAPDLGRARDALERSARGFEQAAAASPAAAPPPADLDRAVQQGAEQARGQVVSHLARRLWQRRAPRPLSLPSLTATRVFAADKPAMAPLYVGDAPRPLPAPDHDQDSLLGHVQRNLGRQEPLRPDAPQSPQLSMLGRSMARAIHQLAAKQAPAAAGAPNPFPSGAVAPRMASTPSNIFADTSSSRMQQVYLPVLARMSQTGRASAPRAQRRTEATIAKDIANPESLFSVLLGEYGERLWRERPEIAKRLEASLKEVAEVLPASGSAGMTVLQRYTEQFRRNVETWLGGGQDSGPNQEKHEHIVTPEAEATRAVGEQMGGLEAADTTDVNQQPANLIEQQAEDVERRLRIEKTSIDNQLVEKVSRITGKQPARHIEAFRGPMAEQIAKEMGAKAFTVRNQMFLPQGADESLIAHEMVHAIEDNASADPSQIQKEEMVAYGVQQEFQQGREKVEQAMQRASERMELAKDTNRKPMRLSTEPGGVAGAPGNDPGGAVQQHNADRYQKEQQVLESLADAVEDLLGGEETISRERYGDY
jgi:hypothetical protein